MRTFSRSGYLIFVAILVISGFSHLPTASAQGGPGCFNPYTVVDGDTLWRISQRFDVDMRELAIANTIQNPSYIRIGDTLCLDGLVEAQPAPGDFGTGGPNTPNTPAPAPNTPSGNTPPTPAPATPVDPNAPSNNTGTGTGTGNTPAEPTPPTVVGRANATGTFNGRTYTTDSQGYYTVQRGDNLFRIASAFGLTTNDLATVNNLANRQLIFSGNRLLIPAPGSPTTPTTPTDPGPTEPTPVRRANESVTVAGKTYTTDSLGYYTVQRGDTLYNLAYIFGVSTADLAVLNPSLSSGIFSGQRLAIPDPTPSEEVPGTVPAVSLVPRMARPGDTVTVAGYNYPPNTDVELFLEKFSQGRISSVLGTVETDENGTFETTVVIPATWPDNSPVNTRTVSISARSLDKRFWGSNFFINLGWTN